MWINQMLSEQFHTFSYDLYGSIVGKKYSNFVDNVLNLLYETN